MEPDLSLLPDSRVQEQSDAPARGAETMPEATSLKEAPTAVLTDPSRVVDELDLAPKTAVPPKNGTGTHPNGNGAHPNGYAHGVSANGTNGHSYPNGHSTNGVNGYGTNGNGNGIEHSLNLAAYSGVFERNGNGNGNHAAADAAYARLAVLEVPGELPVALPWLGAGEMNPASFYLRFGKRALDVVIAGIGLLVLSPLFLLLAALIKIDSRGPVFYKSKRLGRNGRAFTFYKFRSMYVGAHEDRHKVEHLNEKTDGPVFKISSDPRTTQIGRIIRQTSLDELPQLANVLRGEMTLVGPRPPLPEEVAQYQSWHRRRLEVKPGITCLWQISGRSRLGFNEWMRLDLEYIKRQSLATDLKILLRTLPAVVSREGAY